MSIARRKIGLQTMPKTECCLRKDGFSTAADLLCVERADSPFSSKVSLFAGISFVEFEIQIRAFLHNEPADH